MQAIETGNQNYISAKYFPPDRGSNRLFKDLQVEKTGLKTATLNLHLTEAITINSWPFPGSQPGAHIDKRAYVKFVLADLICCVVLSMIAFGMTELFGLALQSKKSDTVKNLEVILITAAITGVIILIMAPFYVDYRFVNSIEYRTLRDYISTIQTFADSYRGDDALVSPMMMYDYCNSPIILSFAPLTDQMFQELNFEQSEPFETHQKLAEILPKLNAPLRAIWGFLQSIQIPFLENTMQVLETEFYSDTLQKLGPRFFRLVLIKINDEVFKEESIQDKLLEKTPFNWKNFAVERNLTLELKRDALIALRKAFRREMNYLQAEEVFAKKINEMMKATNVTLDVKETQDETTIPLNICGETLDVNEKWLKETSLYFKALIEGGFQKMEQGASIDIEAKTESEQILLAFIKSKKIIVTEQNIKALLECASDYSIPSIIDACGAFIIQKWFAQETNEKSFIEVAMTADDKFNSLFDDCTFAKENAILNALEFLLQKIELTVTNKPSVFDFRTVYDRTQKLRKIMELLAPIKHKFAAFDALQEQVNFFPLKVMNRANFDSIMDGKSEIIEREESDYIKLLCKEFARRDSESIKSRLEKYEAVLKGEK